MIKFYDILTEIGINNPNKIKAKISRDRDNVILILSNNGNPHIFLDGNQYEENFHNYYIRAIGNINNYDYEPYFRYLHHLDKSYYGIPKSQVQIVDKLDEIGINNPNNIKARSISSSRIMIEKRFSFADGSEYGYSDYWTRFISNLSFYENKIFFRYLVPLDGFGLYGILKSRVQVENKLQEIGINNPNKIPVNLFRNNAETDPAIEIDEPGGMFFYYDNESKTYYRWFDEFQVKRLKKSQYFHLLKLENEKHTYSEDSYLYVIPENAIKIIKTIG